ncbi:unnamed protein product [Anisakis simplex]|uniref:Uncharacterized protein n=1 Tax=Anisakis simplex TaxID=6269 RepID=A0A0M3JG33_ANISI|nr:unnamed protein product [Anisakis simplex]
MVYVRYCNRHYYVESSGKAGDVENLGEKKMSFEDDMEGLMGFLRFRLSQSSIEGFSLRVNRLHDCGCCRDYDHRGDDSHDHVGHSFGRNRLRANALGRGFAGALDSTIASCLS